MAHALNWVRKGSVSGMDFLCWLLAFSVCLQAAAFVPQPPPFSARLVGSDSRHTTRRMTRLRVGQIDDSIMEDMESKMKKSLDAMTLSLESIRTGRATPKMLDRVIVNYYETPTPLHQHDCRLHSLRVTVQ